MYLICFCASCTDTDIVKPSTGTVGTEEVMATLRFSYETTNPVNITTRATLDVVPESRVQNLFVYLCVGDACVYTHYFDKENLMGFESEITTAKWNCWYVDNLGVDEDPALGSDATHGIIRMRTVDVTGATLYLVANIDADMVNISPEKLNTIRTKQEIENLTATLNQEITSRNGYFPMSSVIRDVSIANNTVLKDGEQVTAELVRLDAKVRVNVRTAVGNVNSETVGEGDNEVITRQHLNGFIPQSWRVINLPKGAYVMPYVTGEGERINQDYEEAGYFNTEAVGFEESIEEKFTFVNNETMQEESITQKTHSFSFYMLENQESFNRGGDVQNYHSRDLRTKDPITGKYINGGVDGGIWDNAPELATYLEIKGQIEMDVDVSTSAKQQHLAADVTYYIHLGDFATSLNNYDIIRNTSYTYTITIKGVNSIEVEVKTSQDNNASAVEEKESGATGQVYVAEEEIFTFDAHYGQRVYMIDAANIDPQNVTWYVSTPFSEGVPEIVGGTEVPAGKDYKWVQFMLNDIEGTGENKAYSKNNQSYPGDGSSELKDVVEFTKFIKAEVTKIRDNNPNTNSEYFIKECDDVWFDWYQQQFPDEELDKEDDTKPWWRDRMYVTIFVDEFYYEVDPITGNEREGLWKEFVNQPNRLMHILCDNQESLDQASSSTGSIVTIRQRSIQTPYNINKEGLQDAWGCEVVDETANKGFFFYSPKENMTSNANYPTAITTNNSEFNGRYNTAILWGVLSDDPSHSFNASIEWKEYLEYERPNNYINENDLQTDFLRDDYAVMRYAPLTRNRDNNGNGIIDADEIRWYIASIDQLYGLYIGQLGLSSDAILYSIENTEQVGEYESTHPYAGAHKWRKHIVSSTSTGGHPVTLWGEEGISTSNYGAGNNNSGDRWGKPAPYSIRCVRNLGMNYATEEDARTALRDKNEIPTKLVKVIEPSSPITTTSVYKFDLTNINEKSLRFYTTRELEPSNEHSEMSRLYRGFQTGTEVTTGLYQDNGSGLYYDLLNGKTPCPDKWRVPNVREAALMSLYCAESWWGNNQNYIAVSSFYSNGTIPWGNGNDDESPSWQFTYRYATIGNNNTTKTRTVQDWDPTSEE